MQKGSLAMRPESLVKRGQTKAKKSQGGGRNAIQQGDRLPCVGLEVPERREVEAYDQIARRKRVSKL